MELELFKTLWGATGPANGYSTFDEVVPAVAADGFDGVAFALISLEFEPGLGTVAGLADVLSDHGLGVSTMVHTFGDSVRDHLADLEAKLDAVEPLGSRHIVCHGGMDWFDDDQAVRFFEAACGEAADRGIAIAHETHRHRILYNPWTTMRMLERVPELALALDLSHWVVVAERLIHDQIDIIKAAARRSIHIDARVGYAEGPQVPDPRDPAWSDELHAHLSWWRTAWTEQADAGCSSTFVVPEFGPPPYQQTLPHTGEPVADLWEICGWMADRIRSEFAAWTAGVSSPEA